MNAQEIDNLIEKYLNGTATPEEREKVLLWYRGQNQDDVEWILDSAEEENIIKDRVLNNLKAEIKKQKPAYSWYSIAASIVLVLSISLYFWKNNQETLPKSAVLNDRYKNDVPHGGNKAILKLGDGSKITLDNTENGLISNRGNVLISKTEEGQLVYKFIEQPNSKSEMNTISTPKGGQYQVILSDGTKVWLNAESSLTFPTTFSEDERQVKTTGEIYFEVAKAYKKKGKSGQRLPFIVETNKQEVEVLGTHFNVMAYAEEQKIATTLIEGSVRVSSLGTSGNALSGKSILLEPGQQANLRNEQFNITAIDTEEIISWKNGYFMFNNEDIRSVMRKISRWYDVEVVYQDNSYNKALWGTVSRFQNVSEVLNTLELTGIIHFKIEGRRITVMP